MNDTKTTVLFVAGSGRSGSTLLSNILGSIDGFFAGGELAQIWQRGLREDRLCGCGVRFSRCTVWREILDRAFGSHGVDAARMLAEQRHDTHVRRVPSMLLGSRVPRDPGKSDLGRQLSRLYAAITDVTGCRVIVDSSKRATFGRVLESIPSIDLYVVHLVRDPRAAAYSWSRRKVQPDRGYFGYMRQQSVLTTSRRWAVWNATAAALWRRSPQRYLRLRYEDLVARPRESLERILTMVGHQGAATPFVDEHTVAVERQHSVSGNPVRLDTGTRSITPDVEWRTRLRWPQRAAVTLLTLPLLHYFGYPRRPTRDESALSAAGEEDVS